MWLVGTFRTQTKFSIHAVFWEMMRHQALCALLAGLLPEHRWILGHCMLLAIVLACKPAAMESSPLSVRAGAQPGQAPCSA